MTDETHSESAPLASSHRSRLPSWLVQLGSFLAFVAVLSSVHTASPGFTGVDGYFHARYAQLMGRESMVPEFPWTRESLWIDDFSDKEVLFHAYLRPWVRLGESFDAVISTVEFGAAVLLAAMLLVIVNLLRSLGVQQAFWWTLLMSCASGNLVFRLSMVRPGPVAILLLVIALLCLLDDRWLGVGAVALVMPLIHTAFHVLPVMLLVLFVSAVVNRRSPTFSSRSVTAIFVGLVIGCLAHPHFPSSIKAWFVVNVRLPLFYSAAKQAKLAIVSQMPGEFLPVSTLDLLIWNWQPLAIVALAGLVALNGKRASDRAIAVASVMASFGLLMLVSSRFLEYFGPLAVVFTAFYLGPSIAGWRRWATSLLVICLAGPALEAGRSLAAEPRHGRTGLRDAALWLEENTIPGEGVFQMAFDQFPMLWYYNSSNTYQVALDPIYFCVRDAMRCEKWARIGLGESKDPASEILGLFGTRWAVVDTRNGRRLIRQLEIDPRATKAFEDPLGEVMVYRIEQQAPSSEPSGPDIGDSETVPSGESLDVSDLAN